MPLLLLLIVFSYLSQTIGFSDDFAERLAEILSMSKADVQICMNKTNVVPGKFTRSVINC